VNSRTYTFTLKWRNVSLKNWVSDTSFLPLFTRKKLRRKIKLLTTFLSRPQHSHTHTHKHTHTHTHSHTQSHTVTQSHTTCIYTHRRWQTHLHIIYEHKTSYTHTPHTRTHMHANTSDIQPRIGRNVMQFECTLEELLYNSKSSSFKLFRFNVVLWFFH